MWNLRAIRAVEPFAPVGKRIFVTQCACLWFSFGPTWGKGKVGVSELPLTTGQIPMRVNPQQDGGGVKHTSRRSTPSPENTPSFTTCRPGQWVHHHARETTHPTWSSQAVFLAADALLGEREHPEDHTLELVVRDVAARHAGGDDELVDRVVGMSGRVEGAGGALGPRAAGRWRRGPRDVPAESQETVS